MRFFFWKEKRFLEASFNETSFLRSHPFLQWKFLFFPLLSPLFYESHSCSLEFLSSRTWSPLFLVHLSKKIIFLYSSIRFTFYPRNRTLYSLSSLSFLLRRNISLHTTWFRIISLLKFYFFLLFFSFSFSRNILLSRVLRKPSSIIFSLTKFFVRILFTPFLRHSSLLKKILVYRYTLKESKTRLLFEYSFYFIRFILHLTFLFLFFFFLLPLKWKIKIKNCQHNWTWPRL